jgi:hypothetical protein
VQGRLKTGPKTSEFHLNHDYSAVMQALVGLQRDEWRLAYLYHQAGSGRPGTGAGNKKQDARNTRGVFRRTVEATTMDCTNLKSFTVWDVHIFYQGIDYATWAVSDTLDMHPAIPEGYDEITNAAISEKDTRWFETA